MNSSLRQPAASSAIAPADDPRVWLSALVDGEAPAVTPACQLWRQDVGARQTWHTYHLIGDVMRSQELAQTPKRDLDFLNGLRARLALEPAILAPTPAPTHRMSWRGPAAVAAGFAVVALVLGVSRSELPATAGAWSTVSQVFNTGLLLVSNGTRETPPPSGPAEVTVIRDERLDEFLRAHQAARGGVAVAAPGGALRRVDGLVPAGNAP